MPVYAGTGVQLGDIRMYADDTSTRDAYGVNWGLTQLDGWDDGWEGNSSIENKSNADGSWISPQYATARVVHIGGTIDADTYDDATRAWNRLLAQLPFRTLGPITISHGEGTEPELTAMIRQHERPAISDRFGGTIEFSLSLVAPDPRRYAVSAQSTSLVLPFTSGGLTFPIVFPITFPVSTTVSQAVLTNAGNVNTYPVLTVTGPCPPARIVNLTTSEVIRVVDTVQSGDQLVIDVASGVGTINGQPRRVLGTWWSLQPGANTVAFMADGYNAAAGLTISYRSAWK